MTLWRTGRKVGRTIYAQGQEEPSDHDALIGVMDTRALAREAVEAHNAVIVGQCPRCGKINENAWRLAKAFRLLRSAKRAEQ